MIVGQPTSQILWIFHVPRRLGHVEGTEGVDHHGPFFRPFFPMLASALTGWGPWGNPLGWRVIEPFRTPFRLIKLPSTSYNTSSLFTLLCQ